MQVKKQKKANRNKLRGMSLLEIMIVMTLIALVTAGIGVAVFGSLESGQIKQARTQAYEVAKALDLYKLNNGSYPTTAQGLQALVKPPKGKPLMESLPKDPWNNDYIYVNPGSKNTTKFDVRSKGPDGTENNEDDVGNWEE